MRYDSVKDTLSSLINRWTWLRRFFFIMLDMLFLRQQYVKKIVKELYPDSDRPIDFYDAGAGFCQYSDFILTKWKRSNVLAVDLKGDYLEDYSAYALAEFDGRFTHLNSDLVQYKPDRRFDLIAAIDILEHIENDTQVLINFGECLKPEGILVISTPSDMDEAAKFTAEHVRPGYSKQEICFKLEQTGFTILRFMYSYGHWGKISWKLAVKTPIKLISYSKLLLLALPMYYLCLYPFIYLFMKLDIATNNLTGNGIIIVSGKKTISS